MNEQHNLGPQPDPSAGDVSAEAVNLVKGGARDVFAHTATITQGGAREVKAESVTIRQGGADKDRGDERDSPSERRRPGQGRDRRDRPKWCRARPGRRGDAQCRSCHWRVRWFGDVGRDAGASGRLTRAGASARIRSGGDGRTQHDRQKLSRWAALCAPRRGRRTCLVRAARRGSVRGGLWRGIRSDVRVGAHRHPTAAAETVEEKFQTLWVWHPGAGIDPVGPQSGAHRRRIAASGNSGWVATTVTRNPSLNCPEWSVTTEHGPDAAPPFRSGCEPVRSGSAPPFPPGECWTGSAPWPG